jgi:hypothetical protein
MPFIGNKPSAVPLTSADIADGIITSAKIVDGTIVNADINASAAIASTKLSGVGATAGQVIQVVSQFYDTQTSISNTSFIDTGLTLNITPASASNKILAMFYPSFSADSNSYCAFKLFRDATEIGTTTNTGTGIECFTGFTIISGLQYSTIVQPIVYLDSPNTTSAITYKLQVSPMRTSNMQFYLNRSHTLGDDNQFRTASNVILMEIKG